MSINIRSNHYLLFFVMVISFLVLTTWRINVWDITSLGDDYIPMAPSTALNFILISISLLLITSFARKTILVLTYIFALLYLGIFIFQISGLELFSPFSFVQGDIKKGSISLGKMSALTSLAFFFVMINILLLHTKLVKFIRIRNIFIFLNISYLGIILFGYLTNKVLLLGNDPIPMAFFTLINFMVLWININFEILKKTRTLLVYDKIHEIKKQATPAWVIFMVLFIIIIIIAGFFFINKQSSELLDKTHNELSSIAILKEHQITKWYTERYNEVNLFYSSDLLRTHAFEALTHRSKSNYFIQDYIDAISDAGYYSSISLYNSQGKLILVCHKSHTSNNYNEDAFQQVMRTKSIFFHDIHFRQNTNQKSSEIAFSFWVPVLDKSGDKVVGAWCFRIDPRKYLFPLIKEWPYVSKSSEALIVRQDKNDLIFLSDLKFHKTEALSYRTSITKNPNLPAAKAITGYEGIFHGLDYRNHKVVSFIKKVNKTPWYLIVKTDQEEIFLKSRKTTILTGSVFMSLVILSILSLSYFIKKRDNLMLTKQLSTEKEKHALQEDLRIAVEAGKMGLWYWDLNSNTFSCSALVSEIFEFSEEDKFKNINNIYPSIDELENVSYEVIINYIYQEDRELFDENLLKVLSEHKDIDLELRISKNASRIKWVSFKGKGFYTENGDLIRINGIIQDITVRKEEEKELYSLNQELEKRVEIRTSELQSAYKELESFSYSVSHDLRSPLRGIDGWSLALIEDYADKLDEQANNYLNKVRSETQRMGLLIDALLQLAKVSREEIQKREINMSLIAEKYMAKVQENDNLRSWEINIEPNLLIFGDYQLIEIVIHNLLSNACKFTKNKEVSKINFSKKIVNTGEVFYISDNGVGFDMKYSNKLFGAFQRLHKSSDFPGTGIGLATIKRIISRHHGNIWVESEPEIGTTFYFNLGEDYEK